MSIFKSLIPSRKRPSKAKTKSSDPEKPEALTPANLPRSRPRYAPKPTWSGNSIFNALRPDKSLKPPPTETVLVTKLSEVDKILQKCREDKLLVFDFETTGLDAHLHQVVSVQITSQKGIGYYIPMFHRDYEHNLDRHTVLKKMSRLFADPDIRILAHNLKFDYKWMYKEGFREINNFWDTYIAAHVRDETRNAYSLKALAAADLGYAMTTFGSLGIHTKSGPCPPDKIPDFSYLPLEKALPYACADVDMTLRLYEHQMAEITQEYATIFFQIEMPLIPVLARMEFEGVEMDAEYMKMLGSEMKVEIDKLYKYLNALVQDMGIVNMPEPDPEWIAGPPPTYDPLGVEAEVAGPLGHEPAVVSRTGFLSLSLPGDVQVVKRRGHVWRVKELSPFNAVLEKLNRKRYYKKLTGDGFRKKRADFVDGFKWGSSAHLLSLFSILGIDTGRLTPASRKRNAKVKKMSTDKKALQSMARDVLHRGHKIAKALLGYRQLTKIHSAFCEKLPGMVHPVTGRIHPSFNQARTVTARLSCNEPNMQQIPKTGVCAVRYPFKPRDGYLFLQCDYSQIELRILAHIAGDEGMMESFRSGADIHSQTAYECFAGTQIPVGTPIDKIKELYPHLRTAAKVISFGIVYGMGPKTLAENLGITEEKAKDYIKAFLDAKPKVKEYIILRQRDMWRQDYVETPLGRRRHIPEYHYTDDHGKKRKKRPFGWERQAVNFPIQSASAEILKHVMARLDDVLHEKGLPAKIILQIHDELIIECKEEYADVVLPIIKQIFEEAVEGLGVVYDVPLSADPAVQIRWAIEVDKCGDCDRYGLALDGGKDNILVDGQVVIDPKTDKPKTRPTKTCLRCNPTDTPGLWDLKATFKTIEAKAISEEE